MSQEFTPCQLRLASWPSLLRHREQVRDSARLNADAVLNGGASWVRGLNELWNLLIIKGIGDPEKLLERAVFEAAATIVAAMEVVDPKAEALQVLGVRALRVLAKSGSVLRKRAVVLAGSVVVLVRLMNDGTPAALESAVRTLTYVTGSDSSSGAQAVVAAGGLVPLSHLLSHATTAANTCNCVNLVASIASHSKHTLTVVSSSGVIAALVQLVAAAEPMVQEKAAAALWSFVGSVNLHRTASVVKQCKRAVVAAGALTPLVNLLWEGTRKAQENATSCLRNVASEDDCKVAVVSAGAVKPLVLMLRTGASKVREKAAGALLNIAGGCALCKRTCVDCGVVEVIGSAFTAGLPSPQASRVIVTLAGVARNISSGDARCKQAIVDSGTLNALVPLITHSNIELQVHTQLHLLIRLLKVAYLQARAVGVFQNMSWDSECKEAVVRSKALAPLLAVLQQSQGEIQRRAACCIRSLATSLECKTELVASGEERALVAMLSSGVHPKVQARVAGAISNLVQLSDCKNAMRNAVAAAGALGVLAELLRVEPGKARSKTTRAALRAVQYIVLGDSIPSVSAAGLIEPLVLMLGKEDLQERAAGVIQNVASRSQEIPALIAAGALLPLVAMLSIAAAEGKLHATGALYNIASHDDEGKNAVIAAGAIKPLLHLLSESSSTAQGRAAAAIRMIASGDSGCKQALISEGTTEALTELTKLLATSSTTNRSSTDGMAKDAARAILLLDETPTSHSTAQYD